MIEARFGLKRRPFDKAIRTRDLYSWPGLEELTARLEMAKGSRGIMLLTGEPGTGKTVALRRFVDSLNAEHYRAIYLPLATVTVIDAYAQLNRALGGQEMVRSKSLLFREIQAGIAQLTARGAQPVIILDEADLLRSPLFDELGAWCAEPSMQENHPPRLGSIACGQADEVGAGGDGMARGISAVPRNHAGRNTRLVQANSATGNIEDRDSENP